MQNELDNEILKINEREIDSNLIKKNAEGGTFKFFESNSCQNKESDFNTIEKLQNSTNIFKNFDTIDSKLNLSPHFKYDTSSAQCQYSFRNQNLKSLQPQVNFNKFSSEEVLTDPIMQFYNLNNHDNKQTFRDTNNDYNLNDINIDNCDIMNAANNNNNKN